MRRRTDGARKRRFCDELTVPAIEVERTGLCALSLQRPAGRQRGESRWSAERRRHQGIRRTSPTCFPSHQDEYFDLVDPETIRPIDVVEGPVASCAGSMDWQDST